MGKIKSAICLTIITLAIAVLCLVCFVPFPVGSDGIRYFNPIVNWTDKSADLGGYQFGDGATYYGGSFGVTLYPEGVVSQRDYRDNLEMLEEDERQEYEEKYVSYLDGKLYLDKEQVCDGDSVSEEFKESFRKRLEILKVRFEKLHSEGLKFSVVDDYTVRVTLPASLDASIASFLYFSYMGDFEVSYGSDLASATRVFPEEGRNEKPIEEYIKSVGTRSINGTTYIAMHFTKTGADLIASATANAESSSGTLFFTVGGDQVIGLSASSQIREKDLYISGEYTEDAAKILATVMDTSIKYDSDTELGKMELGELYQNEAFFRDNALVLVYVAIGVMFVLSLAALFVRFRGLAVAHLYSFLIYLIALLLCVWAIPSLSIGMNTLAAFAITAMMLFASNALSYESARKEYALGKTYASSVKTGYKKCFFGILDIHIAAAAIGLLVYFIAVAELSAFGLVLALGALISGIASLAINRFMWYLLTPLTKNVGKFCHFKREETEDE